jgi:cobalt/nickel transport system permease protein
VSEGFLQRNISSFTQVLESVVVSENLSHTRGLLQVLDPRVKLGTFVLFVIIVGLARSFLPLLLILGLVLLLSILSRLPAALFIKRVLLFIPIFTAVIALPALFLTPGEVIWRTGSISITLQGLQGAGLLFLRVTDSLSFGVLLVLTTSWNRILVALRWYRIPSIVVDILGMTYRYIFLLLHTANNMFLARRSRSIRNFAGAENRRWLSQTLATVLQKSQHMSEEVYLAMLSRGYQGEIRVASELSFKRQDFLWLMFALIATTGLVWVMH